MHSIENKLKEQMGADAQGSGYICTVCGEKYSSLDVASLYNPMSDGFVCDVCQGDVTADITAAANQVNQEKLGALMSQIKPIIDALRKIDDIQVSENTFQSSLAEALPPPLQPVVGQTPAQTPTPPRTEVAVRTNGSTQSLHVNITSDKENAEIERQALEEKKRVAEQNALPTWHLQSTVGKIFNAGGTDGADSAHGEGLGSIANDNATSAVVAGGNETTKQDKADEDAVAAYYRQLELQRAADEDEEEDEDDEEEEEDDDDDEAEFEDVA
jgi:transcription initiation factor TFIIE subunit alpha